jgi:hypothetical protein
MTRKAEAMDNAEILKRLEDITIKVDGVLARLNKSYLDKSYSEAPEKPKAAKGAKPPTGKKTSPASKQAPAKAKPAKVAKPKKD